MQLISSQFLLFTLTTFIGTCVGFEIKITDCGSKGKIDKVVLTPCDTDPCTLYAGETSQMSIHFTPAVGASSGKASATGTAWGITKQVHLTDDDLCRHLDVKCPVSAGESAGYSIGLPTPSSVISIGFWLEWHLKNEKGESLVCFTAPLRTGYRSE